MINAISAGDIAFIMSSSTSAWLLSPLKAEHFTSVSEDELCQKMCNKKIIEFGFRMVSWTIKTSCLCYLPQPSASADNIDLGFDNSWYHAQPHPIIFFNRLTLKWICLALFLGHLILFTDAKDKRPPGNCLANCSQTSIYKERQNWHSFELKWLIYTTCKR